MNKERLFANIVNSFVDSHELTLIIFLFSVKALGNHNFIVAIICHLQYEATVYQTVSGFESSVDDVMIVEVLHRLIKDVKGEEM